MITMNLNNFGASSMTDRIRPMDHHVQLDLCTSRPKYRQGKEFKAVKVYTVNQESVHLLIQGIPAVGLDEELRVECEKFGQVEAFELIPNYPAREQFTHVFYVKYGSLREARFAKKKLDNRSFYGGPIHICYAPELESVSECAHKLFERKRYLENYYSSGKNRSSGEQKQSHYCPLGVSDQTIEPTIGCPISKWGPPDASATGEFSTTKATGARVSVPQFKAFTPNQRSWLPSQTLWPTSILANQKSHLQSGNYYPNVPSQFSSSRNFHWNPNQTQETEKLGISYSSRQTTCSHSQGLQQLLHPFSAKVDTPCAETVTREANNFVPFEEAQVVRTSVGQNVANFPVAPAAAGTSTTCGCSNLKRPAVPSSASENENVGQDEEDSVGNEQDGTIRLSCNSPGLTTKGNLKKKLIELKKEDKAPNRIVFHNKSPTTTTKHNN